MITAVDYNSIIKIVRKQIIEQLKIKSNRVLNAEAVRGADLTDIVNNTDVMSIKLSDVFIIFEMIEKENDDNVIIPENDNTVSVIATYDFILKIYGNMSHMCAQQLRAMFKTAEVASMLRNNGVYLKGITSPTNQKEFINNTLWPRCDMTFELQCRHNFMKLYEDEFFSNSYSEKDIDFIIKKI